MHYISNGARCENRIFPNPLKTFKSAVSSWLSVVSFYPRRHLLNWHATVRWLKRKG